MATIGTAIQLVDQVTSVAEGINQTIGTTVALYGELDAVAARGIDLDVYDGGMEDWRQDLESVLGLSDRLFQSQLQLQNTAMSTQLIPPNAMADITSLTNRVTMLRVGMEAVGRRKLDMGAAEASGEMETLRARLTQAVAEQEALNAAVERNDIAGMAVAYERLNQTVGATEKDIRGNVDQQEQFNQALQRGGGYADSLGNKIASFVGTYLGAQMFRRLLKWGQDALEMFGQSSNAEIQLQVSLANAGAVETAFDDISDRAAALQDTTIYDSGSLVAGGAEFATYLQDAEAIQHMMGTLTNYAAGMSGGGEVDSRQMVEYATQLGKVMTGSYAGIKEKGFELTEAQKEIIAYGTDMEKALVLDQVISESWSGLAEAFGSTPQGQIVQFQNCISDFTKEVGQNLTPISLQFMGIFRENLPGIQSLFLDLAGVIGTVATVIGAMVEAGLWFHGVISDNWSIIGPIVLGITAAMLGYKAAMIASSVATTVMQFAQQGLNAAMLANPVGFVIVLIVALIAAFYAAVAAVNKFAGTSYSATGIIAGAFAVLLAFLRNTIVLPLWNTFAIFANFIGNLFNDPVAAVKVLFYDMAQSVIARVLSMATTIETLINKIPGVSVNITAGLERFYDQMEEASQKVKDESEWVEYVAKMDYLDYGEAFESGYAFGEGLEDKVKDFFSMPDMEDYEFNYDGSGVSGIADGVDSIDGNTRKMAGFAEEDLKYLRDIAERDTVNRFTTAELTVHFSSENNINSSMDIDGVISEFEERLTEVVVAAAEGSHL